MMYSKIIHTDLLDDFYSYNAWKPKNSFSIHKNIDEFDTKMYQIVEYVYDGVGSSRNEILYKKKLKEFLCDMQKELFVEEKRHLYFFASEHKVKLKSKLRTYKGFVDKTKVIQEDLLQLECNISKERSIFSFIANLNKSNIDYLLRFFFDDSCSFIIKSDNLYLNNKFIETVTPHMLSGDDFSIDYFRLLKLFVSGGDIIYRIGGDSGEEYWSLQKIMKK